VRENPKTRRGRRAPALSNTPAYVVMTPRAQRMNVAQITTGPVKSVADLIDMREQLGSFLPGPSVQWAFRGQPRDFGALTPSFQRQFSTQSFGAAELIEAKLIEAFRKHYINLPGLSNDMPSPPQIGPGHDMRCLSVMQHYEIPTRLLDWTCDFWTAIYFACSNDPGSTAELWYYDRGIFNQQRSKDQSLGVLMDRTTNPGVEPDLLRRRADNIVAELDPQISPRMRQQYAHHTVTTSVFSDHAPYLIALAESYLTALGESIMLIEPAAMKKAAAVGDGMPERGELTTGEASLPKSERPFPVQRVLIDGACKSKALQFLSESQNITASTIFPDVVGLGRFLRWQFDSLRTMLL
jgi:hypothetical protein